MIKVIVNGALGRMGGIVACEIDAAGDIELAGAVDAPDHEGIGGEICGIEATGDLSAALAGADVAVDFTKPESAVAFLEACSAAGVPAITGTTGLTHQHLTRAREISSHIPVLVSPNMSLGVNLMFQVTEDVARALPGFDIEISEIHHNRKKDSPSGTAAKLAEAALRARTGSSVIHGRQGMIGERPKGEIGMHSLRGGDVTGEHTVVFAGEGERIEITHRAHSRRTFAMGTLRAIRFMAGRQAGYYSMADVLGL
jgi:4-hydroxy-tetrahydrodipicolinate reductase